MAASATSLRVFFAALTVILYASVIANGTTMDEGAAHDLVSDLEKVQMVEERSEKKGSLEKLRVMQEMARTQETAMAAAQRAETERDRAQQAELSQCQADLSTAREKLQGVKRPGVDDLHRLLSPRGASSLL